MTGLMLEGDAGIEVLGAWLATYAIHLTVLLVATGIGLRLAAVRSEALRASAWKGALAAAVFSSALTVEEPHAELWSAGHGHDHHTHGAPGVDTEHPTLPLADPELEDEPLQPAGCSSLGYAPRRVSRDRLMVVRRTPSSRQDRVTTSDWMRRSCPSAISGERQQEFVLTTSSSSPSLPVDVRTRGPSMA